MKEDHHPGEYFNSSELEFLEKVDERFPSNYDLWLNIERWERDRTPEVFRTEIVHDKTMIGDVMSSLKADHNPVEKSLWPEATRLLHDENYEVEVEGVNAQDYDPDSEPNDVGVALVYDIMGNYLVDDAKYALTVTRQKPSNIAED